MGSYACRIDRKWAGMALLSALVLAFLNFGAQGAEKNEKEKNKDKKKTKSETENPADLLKPTPEFLAREAAARNYSDDLNNELATRHVPIPPQMDLELDWYSPHIKVGDAGRVIRGWIKDDLVLLETDKKVLIAVRRSDGVEKWRCELQEAIRYAPAVSRNNVVVNVNNYLVGIEKNLGAIRWRLLPNFIMSCEPLVIDPPAYPKEYSRQWQNLETIFAGSWDGRFHAMYVRARLNYYIKTRDASDDYAAPEFDLFYPWHKTHRARGVITQPMKIKDDLVYYSADDSNVYAITRDGVEREPYTMQGTPVTGTTVIGGATNSSNSMLSSVYVGSFDNSVYCLDRLTLRKKWAFAAGYPAYGNVMSDEPATPYVYVATTDGKLHALQITPTKAVSKNQPIEVPESFTPAWDVKAEGGITVGPSVVYLGTGREKEFPGFKGVTAVEKATGKVLWSDDGKGFFTHYLENHNAWSMPGGEMRLFAVSADNRLICLKEKQRDTGIKVVKPAKPAEPELPKVIKKKAAAEGADAGEKKEGAEKKE